MRLILCDSRLYTPRGDELLIPGGAPGGVANRLDVRVEYPSRWAAVYGPDHEWPYPSHVHGQHVMIHGKPLVLASALDSWYAQLRHR